MNIRVPDTLTVENSQRYIVSIRLCSDGFSFAGYIPSEQDSFFYRRINLDQTKPYLKALKDCFSEYPFFTYTYKKYYIVLADRQYTLAPENVFLEKQASTLMSFVFSSSEDKVLHTLQKDLDIEVVFAIHSEIYDFFSSELINPRFIHNIVPILSLCRKHNLSCFPKQLYVVMHEGIMNAVCFDKGALIFANSFNYSDSADIVYYILYIWKQAGLDQMKDELFLYANSAMFHGLKGILQNYLLKINILEIGLVSTDTDTPLDIKALFECEL
ncbi:MAG: DUF3822 family protein [Tannerella sp.]|jgi:hypothetical protein|nr:DUF3822 family protein [Tannerella sp.]